MANAIQQAGGASEPSSFAPLHTNRLFTGLWTNRSPLSDAAVSSDMEKYGLGRQDSILDGANIELSSKLTAIRRPGTSVYNSQIFPPINRFYPFNTFTLTDEVVRVMADTAATVYDATGPNTKNPIWQKSPGAGPTFFLAVGNTLYFTNGVDNKQWTVPTTVWKPSTLFHMGDKVLDTNGNIQEVAGFLWDAIANITVAASGGGWNIATINLNTNYTFAATDPMQVVACNVAALNEVPFQSLGGASASQVLWNGTPGNVPLMGATNTGGYLASVRTSGGTSGGGTPAWQPVGGVTGDGQVLWINRGPNVVNWGISAPLQAPLVSQAPRPAPPPAWQANTVYEIHSTARSGIFLVDANNNFQVFSGTGTTGGGEPAWNPTQFQNTPDGNFNWFNLGPYPWKADWGYGLGELCSGFDGTQADTFMTTTAGRSGDNQPNPWPAMLGTQISDGPPSTTPTQQAVIWTNMGRTLAWSDIGAGTHITNISTILVGGYLQSVIKMGKSGATAPTNWSTEIGGTTTDGTVVWQNAGPWGVPATAAVIYGYAYKNSVTNDISSMSPASQPISVIGGNQVTVKGAYSPDTQVDTVVLYRTEQGGSTFFYLDEIPNIPTGTTWSYGDTTPDSGLTIQIQAQVAGQGTPLPSGATCMAYHLQRIFVAVGNVVYVSSGPDAIASTSSGNAGFNTTFTAQSKITRFWVSPLGLIVFTVRDSYIILGSGTDSDPLYMTTFVDRLALLHYDAFTTHLTTPYMMLGNQMVVALDPSAGITEVSFPIADRIEAEMNPATAFVTYHSQASRENALYVSDGATEWYRMSATTAPETGLNWSPRAVLETPISAVQSVEILPGIDRLLIGPGAETGPILFRDLNARTDNGNAYTAWATFGSIVLAHPGELAGLTFITLESKSVGTKPALSVLLGEVSGIFESLNRTRQDPPNLPPSKTLYSDRYHFLQSQKPVWCRHFQMTITWPEEDAPNELYTFTIFGQTWSEYRSQ